ncbi:MAG: gliding motility protein GldL [Bacteroidales bacterium]|nr:gliding motility protein GldL [Bacteroidales bacterium]
MINLSEIVQSHGWRAFMAKLYGLGASVVIIGALFKIQHWPLAGTFLTLGLCTEAIIFFFSAFEPLHEEVDWSLVYPELAGLADEEELQHYRKGTRFSGDGSIALARFDELLEKGDIGEELFNRLGEGLKKLSDTTNNLSNISDASVATKEYSDNVRSAAETFDTMKGKYNESAESLNNSMGILSTSYQQLSESVSEKFESINNSNSSYSEKLELLNKNLSALNSVYELQLKGANEQMKDSSVLYKGLGEMMQDLKKSIEETKNYKEEISKLSKNLSELNKIYGNMLSAMSYVTNSNN